MSTPPIDTAAVRERVLDTDIEAFRSVYQTCHALSADVMSLCDEIDRLRRANLALAERCAGQSELLSKRGEREPK